MSAQDKFVGWIAHDAKSIEGTMTWEEYTPKKFTEDDVEVRAGPFPPASSAAENLR